MPKLEFIAIVIIAIGAIMMIFSLIGIGFLNPKRNFGSVLAAGTIFITVGFLGDSITEIEAFGVLLKTKNTETLEERKKSEEKLEQLFKKHSQNSYLYLDGLLKYREESIINSPIISSCQSNCPPEQNLRDGSTPTETKRPAPPYPLPKPHARPSFSSQFLLESHEAGNARVAASDAPPPSKIKRISPLRQN